MVSSLKNFALERIWCGPRQDDQYTIKPKRITAGYGAINRTVVLDRSIDLPTRNEVYHVYQIGQLHAELINIHKDHPDWLPNRWIDGHEIVNTNDLVLMVYSATGLVLPNFSCYFMFMDERNLIMTVRQLARMPVRYDQDDLFIRVYRNAFYSSDRYDHVNHLTVRGMVANSIQDILDIQALYHADELKPGACLAYVNGCLVDEVSLVTAQVGDCIEYTYDPSVLRVVSDMYLNDLRPYYSQTDANQKYLIHYPFDDNNSIEYYDDNEIFLVRKNGGRYKGLYLARQHPSTARMITHRDYGVSTSDMDRLAGELADVVDDGIPHRDLYTIRLYIRQSGYARPLVYEHHRIHELYKLPESLLLESILSSGDSNNVWRCETLEGSSYTELMSNLDGDITDAQVLDALGYNSIAYYYGQTPQVVDNPIVELPELLRNNSTVYEYDADGLLLGYGHHANGSTHILEHYPETCLIEAVVGRGTDTPEQLVHAKTIAIPSDCDYRIYRCYMVSGIYTDWDDITAQHELYSLDEDTRILTYLPDEDDVFIMVRTDRTFLACDLEVTPINGMIGFNILERIDMGTGINVTASRLPWLQLDVFMNGRSLIEGIHYHVDYPRVIIVDKKYIRQPAVSTPQQIHIRARGLVDGERERSGDVGFIEHGYLSNNNRFDLRDDQVLRIVVDGCLKTRADVRFSEDHSGIGILDASNGLPYMVRDLLVPMRVLTHHDTYELRRRSQEIDRRVRDYLTMLIPEPDRGELMAVPSRYPVYSPFISAIIHAVLSGAIPSASYTRTLSDHEVREICASYETWLAYDPITASMAMDQRYVIVHPHHQAMPLAVGLHAYRFISHVVRLYASVPVELSALLTIET